MDPVCSAMAASPLAARPGLPGPAILGFVACGAVVRRTAFLDAGGFNPRFGIGGEERLLALDMATGGWELAYVDSVVAHHHPDADAARPGRRARTLRNDLWTTWLRRRLPGAAVDTRPPAANGCGDGGASRAAPGRGGGHGPAGGGRAGALRARAPGRPPRAAVGAG